MVFFPVTGPSLIKSFFATLIYDQFTPLLDFYFCNLIPSQVSLEWQSFVHQRTESFREIYLYQQILCKLWRWCSVWTTVDASPGQLSSDFRKSRQVYASLVLWNQKIFKELHVFYIDFVIYLNLHVLINMKRILMVITVHVFQGQLQNLGRWLCLPVKTVVGMINPQLNRN